MLKQLFFIVLISTLCLAQPIQTPSIEFSPKKYICYSAGEKIRVDGKLNEAAWDKAEWTDDFVDIEGAIRPTPRFRTNAKMLWDEKYFYIAAKIEEPDIWGTLKNRDDIIFYDNDFEIFIDPDGDTHHYSEFEMNALNTVWDLLLVQPYRDINKANVHAWDIKGLKSGVKIYGTINKPDDKDNYWTVEVAFTWEAFKEITELSAPPKDQDQWRINFSRVEWKTKVKNGKYQKIINPETNRPYPEDNWVWSPQGIVNMHYPEMWGYVQFSNAVVGGNKVSFVERPDEKAKWYLRQIYYKERIYFQNNGRFTNDLKILGIDSQTVEGYVTPPVIECTAHMFEASIQSVDDSEKIYIGNDGFVWSSKTKK